MNGLAAKGVGILMISSELPEILTLSDRIYVMRGRGHCAGAGCIRHHPRRRLYGFAAGEEGRGNDLGDSEGRKQTGYPFSAGSGNIYAVSSCLFGFRFTSAEFLNLSQPAEHRPTRGPSWPSSPSALPGDCPATGSIFLWGPSSDLPESWRLWRWRRVWGSARPACWPFLSEAPLGRSMDSSSPAPT